MTQPFAGAVLCGGRSSRMGRDKALVSVDGTGMAARVVATLRGAGGEPVVAIGGNLQALRALGLDVVPDLHPGHGPLGGIISALAAFTSPTAAHLDPASAVMVAACDLPWLDPRTVRTVVEALGDHQVAVATSGRVEPLCAVWHVGAMAVLAEQFAHGVRSVLTALRPCDVVEVAVDPGVVRNVNSPADLASDPWIVPGSVP